MLRNAGALSANLLFTTLDSLILCSVEDPLLKVKALRAATR